MSERNANQQPNKDPVSILLKQKQDFIIIGLTGRTGSGCTTSAKILSDGSKAFPKVTDLPQEEGYDLSELSQMRYDVTRQYANSNFPKFYSIKISDFISAIFLSNSKSKMQKYISEVIGSTAGVNNALSASKFKESKANVSKDQKLINFWFGTGEQMPERSSKQIINMLKRYSVFSDRLKKELRHKFSPDGVYTKVYQHAGNSIRKYGKLTTDRDVVADVEHLLYIPAMVDRVIQSLRRAHKKEGKQTRIAIDAFRNPYEIRYFKDRYAAFYLISINARNEDRKNYLSKVHKLSSQNIEQLDNRESGQIRLDSKDERCDKCNQINETKPDKIDKLFIQNVPSCLELSDIHLFNPRKEPENHNALKAQLAWYISLIQHPGLITPTSIERVMQLAYSAKLNSGCISRQVGAVITDDTYSVKAIGWNDVPTGQVPCNLRSLDGFKNSYNKHVYSEYERNDSKFREIAIKELDSFSESLDKGSSKLIGMNLSYCFKTIQNQKEEQKNQVHTRSLHAEENAFLQLSKSGGMGIEGGKLFTTASPCELCAKKAYQLGIKEIIYIDPYPGIARDHIIANGSNPPIIKQFIGAVGDAYHRLYTPLMPYKDELQLLKL